MGDVVMLKRDMFAPQLLFAMPLRSRRVPWTLSLGGSFSHTALATDDKLEMQKGYALLLLPDSGSMINV